MNESSAILVFRYSINEVDFTRTSGNHNAHKNKTEIRLLRTLWIHFLSTPRRPFSLPVYVFV